MLRELIRAILANAGMSQLAEQDVAMQISAREGVEIRERAICGGDEAERKQAPHTAKNSSDIGLALDERVRAFPTSPCVPL